MLFDVFKFKTADVFHELSFSLVPASAESRLDAEEDDDGKTETHDEEGEGTDETERDGWRVHDDGEASRNNNLEVENGGKEHKRGEANEGESSTEEKLEVYLQAKGWIPRGPGS